MERHQQILDQLKREKHVKVAALCEHLDVSAVTIRKDLKLLEDKGLLFRTHGGASLENPYMNERDVTEKAEISAAEKSLIGETAASRIQKNDAIIIASGTTVLELAKAILPIGKINVISSSLHVTLELLKHQEIDIIQLGGNLRHRSASVTGHYAEHILNHISSNQLFMGVDGIDLDFGCTTTNVEEAILNQKMMQSAQKTILLADSSKFGKRSLAKICNLDEISEIITDKGLSSSFVDRIQEMGIKLTLV
ncbi:DeoR/GlpR family DNA-binding transcription regulator [Sediminibacter sp. Hel_I_10]|uniref:DeoR/GlpR family DNA-binding transcription regulator n=1 Tax=Sediminibacter sp. Hel_I_10 TaxID=1392490 RepID=UPI00047BA4EE|nr:DeoR/GlpR family DNA-binding transcription regulator [Sediminibacter sp. Hel_I_10]